MSNYPVILYDLDNKVIPINCISKSNSYFVRSYQLFNIEIIESEVTTNKIYSVKQNPNTTGPDDLFLIVSGKAFTNNDNFGYSIFLTSNTKIKVVGIDNIERYFYIEFKPENILTEEQEHYNDLLVNNNLPTFDELEPAIISENKADMLKRLLLDFKHILRHKGTKKGIEKFLNLIGFNPESIKIYDEYLVQQHSNSTLSKFVKKEKQLTITPNKQFDTKTGNYHVLYDNWIVGENPLTPKNLPNRFLNITDLTDFFIKLERALSLANIYFTLPEQNISFFGLTNSANIEKYLSIAGNTNKIYDIDVHYFRKHIHIDIINKLNTNDNNYYLVKNNLQLNNVTYNSEIKTFTDINSPIVNNNDELYLVDEEIYDDQINNLLTTQSLFGNLLHLYITSPNTYCEYVIENINNPLTKITKQKFWLTNPIELKIVAKTIGTYKITIFIYDIHNNREKYIYEYSISNSLANIDFDIYNSKQLLVETINDLNISIDSNQEILETSPNYILKFSEIPTELNLYFDVNPLLTVKNLSNNNKYLLDSINKNFSVDSVTESIPVNYYDNFLDIISFPYDSNYNLKLRIFNPITGNLEINDYYDINELFVTTMDIFENHDDIENNINSVKYIFITTTEVGINMIKKLYDFVLVNKLDDNDVISIYELTTKTQTKIPVNYDFPLYHINSQNPIIDFVNNPVIDSDSVLIVKSLFPRLQKLNSISNNYYLKLGDVITAKINPKLITDNKNIIWTVKNTFTNEILFQSNDYMLKYRIKENTIYTIICNLKIKNDNYQITKESIQSTFQINE